MSDTLIAGGRSSEADAQSWAGELSPLESRAEVDSLEDLHVRRRQILPEYSVLRALHGSNGKWDAKRKQMLEALKVRHRMSASQRGEKVTDSSVDALAHADEQYEKFVDEGITGATRFIELETEISEIEERIRSREIALYSYNAEVRLAR